MKAPSDVKTEIHRKWNCSDYVVFFLFRVPGVCERVWFNVIHTASSSEYSEISWIWQEASEVELEFSVKVFPQTLFKVHHCLAVLQETQQIPTEEVQLEIYLSNGQKVKVNILTSDQTEDVLEVRMLFCNCFQSTTPLHVLQAYYYCQVNAFVVFNSIVYGLLTPFIELTWLSCISIC